VQRKIHRVALSASASPCPVLVIDPGTAYALGLCQGFALSILSFLAIDRVLDLLTRRADRVRHDRDR